MHPLQDVHFVQFHHFPANHNYCVHAAYYTFYAATSATANVQNATIFFFRTSTLLDFGIMRA